MTPARLKRFAESYLPGSLVRVLRRASRWAADRRYARRVTALRREHDARNAGAAPDEIRLRDGVAIKASPFAREMYEYFCFRDPDIVAEFDAYARFAADRTRLLDVGAEHGFFSLAFTCGRPDRRAVAVEPSPVAYPVLVEQVRLNPAAAVTPLHLAAGEADGEIEMAVRGNHAVTAFRYYSDLAADRLRMPVRTLDGVCRELAFEPDILKIDVEGYELAVLRGASGTLDRLGPVLLLEVHPGMMAALGYELADLVGFLADRGYEHVDPRSGRPAPLSVPPGAGSVRVIYRKTRGGPTTTP